MSEYIGTIDKKINGLFIEDIIQINKQCLCLVLDHQKEKCLFFSLNKQKPAFFMFSIDYHLSSLDSTFLKRLKAKIFKAKLVSIKKKEDDNVIMLELLENSPYILAKKYFLIFEQFSLKPNLILLDMLRDYGKYFSINYLLSKDIIASRLESGISFTEFTYNILQAIDFLTLYRKYDCHIQVGGSDQWGNLTSGLELIRKVEENPSASVMTCHLITRADGKKFGKSEQGALFLNKELTSPYQLYQYFYNTTDEDACKYLKVFTFLSHDDIENIIRDHLNNLGQRIAQKALAYEIVKDIHGEEEAQNAIKMSNALFNGDVKSLNEKQLLEVFNGLIVNVETTNINIVDALIECKLATSKREARQFLSNNAISHNNDKITDEHYILNNDNALFNKYHVLKRGKKLYSLLITK